MLMQTKSGAHATAVGVRDPGCQCHHTRKHTRAGLSCDRCSCILSIHIRFPGHRSGNQVLTGDFMVGQELEGLG